MSLIGRLFRMVVALIAAIFAASLAILIVWPVAPDTMIVAIHRLFDIVAYSERPDVVIAETATSIGRLLMLLLVAPVAVTGLIGEVARLRSALWYVAGTAVVTAAVPWLLRPETRMPSTGELHISALLGIVGVVAGLVYWLIAGRSAHRPARETLPTRKPSP